MPTLSGMSMEMRGHSYQISAENRDFWLTSNGPSWTINIEVSY